MSKKLQREIKNWINENEIGLFDMAGVKMLRKSELEEMVQVAVGVKIENDELLINLETRNECWINIMYI